MSNENPCCAVTPEPDAPALLQYANDDSAQIGRIASASLYAALATASGVAEEAAATQVTSYTIDPPIAFATGFGSLHSIDAVRIHQFRGDVGDGRGNSPLVEVHVQPVNPDGTPATPGAWWTDLDTQLDANDIVNLFPAVSFEEPCDDACLLGDLNITGTINGDSCVEGGSVSIGTGGQFIGSTVVSPAPVVNVYFEVPVGHLLAEIGDVMEERLRQTIPSVCRPKSAQNN